MKKRKQLSFSFMKEQKDKSKLEKSSASLQVAIRLSVNGTAHCQCWTNLDSH